MHFGWQDLLVALLVAAAAVYLARRAWSLVRSRGKAGCGSACGGCASQGSETTTVVQLEPPKSVK